MAPREGHWGVVARKAAMKPAHPAKAGVVERPESKARKAGAEPKRYYYGNIGAPENAKSLAATIVVLL